MIQFVIDEDSKKVRTYHIKSSDKEKESLCGKKTKGHRISIFLWGQRTQKRGEVYCKKCQKIYLEKRKRRNHEGNN